MCERASNFGHHITVCWHTCCIQVAMFLTTSRPQPAIDRAVERHEWIMLSESHCNVADSLYIGSERESILQIWVC